MLNNVKELRLSRGWKTQKELSYQTKLIDPDKKGLSTSTISDIEAYHFTVKGRNLKLLQIAFGVEDNEILRY